MLFHVAFGLPFAIFLLRNFFVGIPHELLEAARMDGASEWTVFSRVVLPLGVPAIASLLIFQFLWVWNDLLVALVFAGGETQPLTVAIREQLRSFSANIDVIAPAAFLQMIVPLAGVLRLPAILRAGTVGGVATLAFEGGRSPSRERQESSPPRARCWRPAIVRPESAPAGS